MSDEDKFIDGIKNQSSEYLRTWFRRFNSLGEREIAELYREDVVLAARLIANDLQLSAISGLPGIPSHPGRDRVLNRE